LALVFAFTTFPVAGAAAQSSRSGSISGKITSDDGAPVANAVVTVRGTIGERTTVSDREGHFQIVGLDAGVYAIGVRAAGYNGLNARTVGVTADADSAVSLALSRTESSLITIGHTQAAGSTLSTSTVPTTTINTQTYANEGYTRISDVLQNDISTTLVHPLDGGSTVLPTSVALRGPDPTETLVDVDGHQVNSGNTGDFDLSLLDPSDYGNIELVKGISPSSLIAPDTIDGAINIRTIEPTVGDHGLMRFSAGSYNSFGETLQATGTQDRLGYAFSLHRTTSQGEVNGPVLDLTSGSPVPTTVGSAIDGSTALAKIRYGFGRAQDGYVELSFHDQSQFRDLSAGLSAIPDGVTQTEPETVYGYEGTTLLAHNAAYGVDLRVPFGNPGDDGIRPYSVLYRHYTSYVSQSVDGPGADFSPYLYNDRDLIDDETVEVDRQFAHASLTLRYDNSNEALTTDFSSATGANDQSVARLGLPGLGVQSVATVITPTSTPGNYIFGLGQTQRFAALRYTYDPTSKLHLTAAGYYSRYSIFGSSLDPRFGASYTPDARTVARFSVGTTYQAPNLPELITAPSQPTVIGQAINIGNPNLQPDRATEYGLGFDHFFETGARQTSASIDFYRVNLRQPSSILAPAVDPNCGAPASAGMPAGPACPYSYPINAGDAVYQGIELQGLRGIAPFTVVRAGFAIRSAYLTAVPPNIQDGTLVIGEQAQGLPLQKGSLSITHAPPLGLTYSGGVIYEGLYNELNQPQFALVNGALGYRLKSFEINVAGTNLTNVFDQHFTKLGVGETYGAIGAPTPSDALALQGAAFNVSVTRRF
jgi:hypothetical protein